MFQTKLLPLIWIIAFIFGLFLVNDWQLELFAAAIITAFLWSFLALNKTDIWHIPQSWPLRLMVGFWLLTFLSVIGSDILSVSVMAFCLFSMMPLTFFTLSLTAKSYDFVTIGKIGAVIYALLSVWALIQFFIFGEYFDGRASHPLNNPNSLSALFSLGFFCALGGLINNINGINAKQKYISLLICVILFGGIVASGSRAALYALLITAIPFLWIMRDQFKGHYRYLLILLSACLIFFISTAWGTDINESLFNRIVLDTQTQNLNQFSNNRFALWAASFDMIKQHGIFGTGIGTYFLYFPEFRLSNDPKGAYYAHNDPLQYWVELGVLGPILFYMFIISVIGRTIQAFKNTTDTQQKLLILTPFFALGAMIIHTHVTFNLYNLSILFVAGFLLGLWFYATQQVLQTKSIAIQYPLAYPRWTKSAILAFPFLAIGGLCTAYIAGEHYNNKARDHMLAGEIEEFTTDVLRSQKIGLNGNYRPYLLAINVPLSLLEEQPNPLTPEQKSNITTLALDYLKHVQKINPRSASAQYYMGKLIEIGHKPALPDTLNAAEVYYKNALKLDPLHITARLAVARILKAQNQSDEALEVLEQGTPYVYITSNALNLYSTLARMHLEKGNTEKSKAYLSKMQNFQKRMAQQVEKDKKSLKTHLFHNSKAQINQ